MPAPFDAYHKWLAIPRAEQPPNHYRLLGLPLFEADQEVIASAAVQRMNWVRKFQKGPNVSLANKLAHEIKAAWKCLINAENKQRYDAELKRKLEIESLGQRHSGEIVLPPVADPFPNLDSGVQNIDGPSLSPQPILASPKAEAFPNFDTPVDFDGQPLASRPIAPPPVSDALPNFDSGVQAVIPPRHAQPSAFANSQPAAPPRETDFYRPPSRSADKRKPRKKQSLGVQLLKHATASIVGLGLGYAILCQFGSQYDFLGLMSKSESATRTASAKPPPEKEPPNLIRPPIATSRHEKPIPHDNGMKSDIIPSTPSQIPDEKLPLVLSDKKPQQEPDAKKQRPSLDKVPVPDEIALKAARELVNRLYPEHKGATVQERIALGRNLLEQALQTNDDLAAKLVLLERSADLIAQSGVFDDELWSAQDEMGRTFEIDISALKEQSLTKAAKLANSPSDFKEIAQCWLSLAGDAKDKDKFDQAVRLVDEAVKAAQHTVDPLFAKSVKDLDGQFRQVQIAFEIASAAKQKLVTNPNDAEAAAVWGKFLCLYKSDWHNGLPVWSKGVGDELTAIAKRDIAEPTEPDVQVKLADDWSGAAVDQQDSVSKASLTKRAAYWYREVLPKLEGVTKVTIEKRLVEIANEFSSFHIGDWVDVLGTVDPEKHALRGKWGRKSQSPIVGSLTVGELMIPVEIDGSYELEVTFTLGPQPRGSYNFAINLPLESGGTYLSVNNNGKPKMELGVKDSCATTATILLLPNRLQYKLKVAVNSVSDRASIVGELEGKKCVQWEGPIANLQGRLPAGRNGSLTFSTSGPIALHSARLRLTSGTASLLDNELSRDAP